MSLGDLVYSLPLAPGEQQLVAISEERETLSVREQEALTAEELQRYQDAADTSTSAVFSSAADEVARGGTEVSSTSRGFSSRRGDRSGVPVHPVLHGDRGDRRRLLELDHVGRVQQLAADVAGLRVEHGTGAPLVTVAPGRGAQAGVADRDAARQRLGAAPIVTKVITNHNHNHALTMQYFQVLRHFGVTSTVEDVQLVCFVPLELVEFLPPLMPIALPSGTYPRNLLLYRYQG